MLAVQWVRPRLRWLGKPAHLVWHHWHRNQLLRCSIGNHDNVNKSAAEE